MQKFIIFSLFTLSLLFSQNALSQAMDLDKARAEKQVTELPTGFIKANNDKLKNFAAEINKKRQKAYEEIAKKNGLTVEQVGAQAAKKIQEKLEK